MAPKNSSIHTIERIWEHHKKLHKLEITTGQEYKAFNQFKKSLEFINEHNSKDLGYKCGTNHLSHWSEDRLKSWMAIKTYKSLKENLPKYELKDQELPSHLDYRETHCVTPVKNQGQCGSCWAFSTTGCIEGTIANKTGTLLSLSEQQLVNCSKENHGCHGGLMELAMKYVIEVDGLQLEENCPYVGEEQPCTVTKPGPGKISNIFMVPEEDDKALAEALYEHGPISIAIDALQPGFMHYSCGIYKSDGSKPITLNHGVTLIGYGCENGQKYWIVRNSWGSSWGEGGYVRVAREDGGIGIGQYAVVGYP